MAHREWESIHPEGMILSHVEFVPEPDAERDLRRDLGLDKDPWGDEGSIRAEKSFDEFLKRQPDLMACVPNIGWQRVRSLDISDPEIGCSSR